MVTTRSIAGNHFSAHGARERRFPTLFSLAVSFAVVLFASALPAESITFQMADSGRSALATFSSRAGGYLDITLSNTYSNGLDFKFTQTDVLSGLFFDIAGSPTLVTAQAMLSPGSVLRLNGDDITESETTSEPLGIGDVGDAWAYKSGALQDIAQQYGLSSVGLSVFGPKDLFHPNGELPHQQGTAPDGIDFGLMPLWTTNFEHDSFRSKVFTQSSVTFSLSGFSGSLADIGNVRFQYGSNLSEFSMTVVVPEPSTLVLLTAVAIGILAYAWKGKKKKEF